MVAHALGVSVVLLKRENLFTEMVQREHNVKMQAKKEVIFPQTKKCKEKNSQQMTGSQAGDVEQILLTP